ncbi:formyltetrahydrofolate deformylase 1, mitochondrial-like isoform X7 [Rhododendron vialii]|uniref:formyltetrahydrofolate deformylase 1, mitochondrial-like isoform X7 n=1 Tax=Rhododendron vialii TaxID=182163 RepID=UPI00265F2282|nr:formyltetrahydrofolate deformylase 1, mitochondrial-like isoform X7 [Rhododendron vialii]
MSLLRRVNAGLPQAIGFTRRPFKSLKFAGESLDASASPALLHGIHVFHCPDVLGIVAKLSESIASRGGNILGADIFVPENNQVFYSRSEFVFDPAKWPRVQMEEDFLKLSKMFNAMRSVVRVPALDPKYKISVLASKQDHCLVDLLHGWQDGRLPVDISCIISNHERGSDTHVIRFLERHGIPYYCLHTTKGNKREAEILDLVQDTDFIVLARYMQAFDAGVKLIGATSHFVTEELDSGPIIEQMNTVFPPLPRLGGFHTERICTALY